MFGLYKSTKQWTADNEKEDDDNPDETFMNEK
jgi:hypothetical protein